MWDILLDITEPFQFSEKIELDFKNSAKSKIH